MLIGGIEAGRYGNLTRDALARAFGLNGSLTTFKCQMEKIRRNDDTLATTIALTKEEAEKNYNEIWV